MTMEEHSSIAHWLEERCQREHLSLRQAAARTGLSHATIADIIKGNHPSPQTITKLVQGFSDGTRERLALEDQLLVLADYRSERPEEEPNELLAQVIDKMSQFNEPQLKMMGCFADFLIEIEDRD